MPFFLGAPVASLRKEPPTRKGVVVGVGPCLAANPRSLRTTATPWMTSGLRRTATEIRCTGEIVCVFRDLTLGIARRDVDFEHRSQTRH